MQTPLQPRGAGRLTRRTAVGCLLHKCSAGNRGLLYRHHAAAFIAARNATQTLSQPCRLVSSALQCAFTGTSCRGKLSPRPSCILTTRCALQAPASAAPSSGSSRPCGPGERRLSAHASLLQSPITPMTPGTGAVLRTGGIAMRDSQHA